MATEVHVLAGPAVHNLALVLSPRPIQVISGFTTHGAKTIAMLLEFLLI